MRVRTAGRAERVARGEHTRATEILCVGEVLWDSLPAGLSLGGAPLNVACHLRALGVPVAMASRVGDDALGRDALREMAARGLGTGLVQVDAARPTGVVNVDVADPRNPTYDIAEPAAWDAIELTDALLRRASAARYVVFGSLAQRHAITRATVARLLGTPALKVFDVNLRPPHVDPEVVRRCLQAADVVKLNDEELRQLAGWFGLPARVRDAARALASTFDCRMVCVTRGRSGAATWHDGAWTEHPGFAADVVDTVGAGDAFLAAVLAGLLAGADDRALLERANLLGAYVTTQAGAVPAHDARAIARIAGRNGGA